MERVCEPLAATMAIDGSASAVTSNSYSPEIPWTAQTVRGPSPGSNLRSSDGPPVQRHALTAARFVRILCAPRWLLSL